MAEVLSQSQIDALLSSMQDTPGSEEPQESRPEKKEEYRKYDFYSPKKFTKDKLKLIEGVYENYARILTSRLNGVLRVSTEMEILAVEEQRYYEFNNGLSDNDVIMLADLKLEDGSKNPPLITHINQVLMVNMIDKMLGGLGNDSEIDTSYTYTEMELALYRKVMSYILGATKDAWSNYIQLELGEQRLEENPSLFQEISLDEPVALVMLHVKMNDLNGRITICIPENLLTNTFSIMDRRKNAGSDYAQDAERTKAAILSRIKDSALTVRAELGEAQVSLKDVYGLKVGDVLDLNKSKNSSLSVFVDKEPWFEGQAGVHKKSVAIKINKRIDRNDEADGEFEELESNVPTSEPAPEQPAEPEEPAENEAVQ